MAVVLNKHPYTIIIGADNWVYLRTRRRSIRFESLEKLYKYSVQSHIINDWMTDCSNSETLQALRDEQRQDGILDAFSDFRDWYESRKSRAKVHLRMVAKLLLWHRRSVEKLWDPSRPENIPRIMEMFTAVD